jgi:hypothetical protein
MAEGLQYQAEDMMWRILSFTNRKYCGIITLTNTNQGRGTLTKPEWRL